MKAKGKINIIIVFLFSAEEIKEDHHLLSFIPSGKVNKKREPFMYLSNEVFKELRKEGEEIWYYRYDCTKKRPVSVLNIAINILKALSKSFSKVEPYYNEYFVFGIKHPRVKGLSDLIESIVSTDDDGIRFNVRVVDPFENKKSSGIIIDFEVSEEREVDINLPDWK